MKTRPQLSFLTTEAIINIGQNIQTARLRRGESMEQAAARAGVSRQTWMRMEEGHPTVSFGLFAEALQLYGFAEQLFELGGPDRDTEGIARDAARRPKRGQRSS